MDISYKNWRVSATGSLEILLFSIILFFLAPILGFIGLISGIYGGYYLYNSEKKRSQNIRNYLEQLDVSFDEITKTAIFNMPFPLMVINNMGKLIWYNGQFKSIIGGKDSLLNRYLDEFFIEINYDSFKDKKVKYQEIKYSDRNYILYHNYIKDSKKGDLVLLYAIDNTQQMELKESYINEGLVMMSIHIDNYDEVPYGYPNQPQNTYNATIGFEWKGFSAFVQFYGVTNVTRQVVFESLSGRQNTVYDEGTYWSKNNVNADSPIPRWISSPTTGYNNAHRYMYDGSYIRLKNAEMSYTWNSGWVKKIGLSSLRLYINGNNLWSWSRMPDDRESNFAGTGWASQGAYPTVKRFNLGLNITL